MYMERYNRDFERGVFFFTRPNKLGIEVWIIFILDILFVKTFISGRNPCWGIIDPLCLLMPIVLHFWLRNSPLLSHTNKLYT